jgi:hypothetical protein
MSLEKWVHTLQTAHQQMHYQMHIPKIFEILKSDDYLKSYSHFPNSLKGFLSKIANFAKAVIKVISLKKTTQTYLNSACQDESIDV